MDLVKQVENLTNSDQAMLDFVIQTANINSGSFNHQGLAQVADVMMDAFESLGCQSERLECPDLEMIDDQGLPKSSPMGPILRFWKRPEAPCQVLLVGHMDTVFASDHHFQTVLEKPGGILHGPGVTDMKGGIAVMRWGLEAFEQLAHKDQLGWEVILTPDEEIGSLGSGPILAAHAKKHHYGLVYEPSTDDAGTLAYERKGSGKFTVIVRGLAAHVGRQFHEGRSAIAAMAHIVQAVDALNGQREDVVLNIGHIHGGGAVNVVPELCICRLDIRMKHVEDESWIQSNLEAIVKKVASRDGIEVELKGAFGRKPKKITATNHKLFEIIKEVGLELGQTIAWKNTGGCCDGNNLAYAGLPNVDTLGVRGGRIHSDEEYLIIDSLIERAQLTAGILSRLAGV